MSTLSDILSTLRSAPDTLSYEAVEELAREYPFFTLPATLLLRHDNTAHILSPEQRSALSARVALNAADYTELAKLLDTDSDKWINFYPTSGKSAPTTESAIDTFLATYGNTDPRETALLERLIFNPTPDYAEVLEMESGDSTEPVGEGMDEQTERINAFLARSKEAEGRFPHQKQPEETPQPQEAPKPARKRPQPKKEPDGTLSESLAKIYIKQGKYAKAYELMSHLPKSVISRNPYYADQMRFLRKAIIATGGTPNAAGSEK